MTIEEIKKASDELFKSFRCGKTYRMGFETGVMWSDKHLQVPKIISKSMKITREKAKELLPIIQAFADGKKIETRYDIYDWTETEVLYLESNNEYRIKPGPKYRPFKSQEECWNEMLKHQPFGWIVRSSDNEYLHIGRIHDRGPYNGYGITLSCNESIRANFDAIFKGFKFVDGTPFGINEKKQ